MRVFVLRRLLQSLVVLLGVSFVVFFILHLTGDPAAVLLPPEASVVPFFGAEMLPLFGVPL